jgi:ABC-type thiamin/hydroxymethylpyrimidine transport system permease subunit
MYAEIRAVIRIGIVSNNAVSEFVAARHSTGVGGSCAHLLIVAGFSDGMGNQSITVLSGNAKQSPPKIMS